MTWSIRRYFRTGWSDDELVILDPMFDSYVSRHFLLSEHYAETFNTPYSHGLSPPQLDTLLARFAQQGVITAHTSSDRPAFGLTARGGSLWESERNPDWGSYCVASESALDGAASQLELVAASPDIGTQFIRLSMECGLYPDLDADDAIWAPTGGSRIYWKKGLTLWKATLRFHTLGDWQATDQKRLIREKTWWSSIDDLNQEPRPC